MRRREFVALLGGAAAAPALPLGAAERPAMPVIGYLSSEFSMADTERTAGFRKGLSEAGFVEDQNVAVEYRRAEGDYTRLPELAADLVRRQVTVIAAIGGEPRCNGGPVAVRPSRIKRYLRPVSCSR